MPLARFCVFCSYRGVARFCPKCGKEQPIPPPPNSDDEDIIILSSPVVPISNNSRPSATMPPATKTGKQLESIIKEANKEKDEAGKRDYLATRPKATSSYGMNPRNDTTVKMEYEIFTVEQGAKPISLLCSAKNIKVDQKFVIENMNKWIRKLVADNRGWVNRLDSADFIADEDIEAWPAYVVSNKGPVEAVPDGNTIKDLLTEIGDKRLVFVFPTRRLSLEDDSGKRGRSISTASEETIRSKRSKSQAKGKGKKKVAKGKIVVKIEKVAKEEKVIIKEGDNVDKNGRPIRHRKLTEKALTNPELQKS